MAYSSATVAASSRALLGVNRVHLPSVDSTNLFAKGLAKEINDDPSKIAHLHVITADEQTAGRGRLSRTWISSKDDVKMTFLFKLRPNELPSAYLLSPLLSIAACDAVKRSAGQQLGIKWPNDIIAGGRRKVGGILCEMESVLSTASTSASPYTSSSAPPTPSFWAVLGIGLNVNSMPEMLGVDRPIWPLSTLRAEQLLHSPTSSSSSARAAGDGRGVLPEPLDVKALEEALVNSFSERLREFQLSLASDGRFPLGLLEEYRRLSVILGKRIKFSLNDAPASKKKEAGMKGDDGSKDVVSGVVEDVSVEGSLVVRVDGEASTRSFLSGEITGLQLEDGVEICAASNAS
jgi:biotin-(acetyl-CoA carboxylase) ligase